MFVYMFQWRQIAFSSGKTLAFAIPMIHGILIERQNAQDDDSSEHDSEDEVALEDDNTEDGDEAQVNL